MSDANVQQPEVIVQPPVEAWAAPGEFRGWWSLSDEAKRCRQQLGLPIDRPVIASGHQAAFWHAGILAKHLAMTAFAASRGWSSAWVVVDQDPEDFAAVRMPVRDRNTRQLKTETVTIAPESVAQALRAGVPPCVIPAFDPVTVLARDWATPSVGEGLHAITSALAAAKHNSQTAADQIARATSSLIPGAAKLINVMATSLVETDLFASLVNQMHADPEACATAYNTAIAASPEAKLIPLAFDPARRRWELPLWTIDAATGLRRRVWSDMLTDPRSLKLAPRALMLTAALRLAACDLFVHGLGGGASATTDSTEGRHPPRSPATQDFSGYDRATERWMRSWLGRELCRSVVVSATLRLPLMQGPIVTPSQVARAHWLAHAAQHNPGLAGDAEAQQHKHALVSTIRAAPNRTAKRAHYLALHAALKQASARTAAKSQELESRAAQLVRVLAEQSVAMDRTWAFPLHAAQSLQALQEAIDHAIK